MRKKKQMSEEILIEDSVQIEELEITPFPLGKFGKSENDVMFYLLAMTCILFLAIYSKI